MLDKTMLEGMMRLDDDRLAAVLKALLASVGVDAAEKRIDKRTARKIRALLGEVTDGDIERASFLAECYKNG